MQKTISHILSLSKRKNRFIVMLLGVVLLALLPTSFYASFPSLCLWDKVLPFCPTCGTTRALSRFFHADMTGAIKYNLNILVTGPLLIFILVFDGVKIITIRKKLKN